MPKDLIHSSSSFPCCSPDLSDLEVDAPTFPRVGLGLAVEPLNGVSVRNEMAPAFGRRPRRLP